MSGFEPVGRWLWSVLQQLGIEREFRVRRALLSWSQIAGETVAQAARPLRMEGGTLWVAVKSSAWAQELQFQKETLLERLNAECGIDAFREIRFVVRNPLPDFAPLSPGSGRGRLGDEGSMSEILPEHIELTPEEQAALERSVAVIEEPSLRAAIYRARAASLRSEKWRLMMGWRRCERCGEWHTESARLCFICRE